MPWDTTTVTFDTTASTYIEIEQNQMKEYYTNFLTGVFTRTRTITRGQFVGIDQSITTTLVAAIAADTDVTEAKASRANAANAWTVTATTDVRDTWAGV